MKVQYVFTIGPIGSRNEYTTFYRTKSNEIWVRSGCFENSLENFHEAVRSEHTGTSFYKEYMVGIDTAQKIIELD